MKFFVDGFENNFPGEHVLAHFLQFGLREATVCDSSGLEVSYGFMGCKESYRYTPEGDSEMFDRMQRVWQEFLKLPEEQRSCRTALMLAFGIDDALELEAARHLDLKSLIEILLNPEELGKVSDWVTDKERAATQQAEQNRIDLFAGLVEIASKNRSSRPFIEAAVASGMV